MPQHWPGPNPSPVFSELVAPMDLCRYGHPQTMSNIANSCPFLQDRGMLDEAEENAVSGLESLAK